MGLPGAKGEKVSVICLFILPNNIFNLKIMRCDFKCVLTGQTRGARAGCELLDDIFSLAEVEPVPSTDPLCILFLLQGFPGLMGEKGDRGEKGEKVGS